VQLPTGLYIAALLGERCGTSDYNYVALYIFPLLGECYGYSTINLPQPCQGIKSGSIWPRYSHSSHITICKITQSLLLSIQWNQTDTMCVSFSCSKDRPGTCVHEVCSFSWCLLHAIWLTCTCTCMYPPMAPVVCPRQPTTFKWEDLSASSKTWKICEYSKLSHKPGMEM